MFKRKKKKTGIQTPEFRKPTPPPPPPTSGSNAVKSNSNDHRTITCLIKRDTTQSYEQWNPVLLLNELAVEYNDGEIVGYKIGDGITKWSQLSYISKLTDVSEFWLYIQTFDNSHPYIAAKIILDPFVINNFLGGNEKCSEQ